MSASLPTATSLPRDVTAFDETWDVVVVGCGLAGATAAIEAHDLGLSAVIVEKMPAPGGISITAGGGFVAAEDAGRALEYLRAINQGTSPEPVLARFAEELTHLDAYIAERARLNGAKLARIKNLASYPFPGVDAFHYIVVESIPGFDAMSTWPHVQSDGGVRSFKVFLDNVEARGIPLRLSCPAERLIAASDGAVRGVWVRDATGARALKARRGVVLACGGFEGDPEMQRQYWPLGTALSAAFRGNTGDGIRMALDVGADLWHMWHFHGSYGFRHPDPSYPLGIRTKTLPNWTHGLHDPATKMSWIVVDRHGKRFMNEYPPYLQDTGHRALDVMDLKTATFTRIPSFLLVDDIGRQLYRLGEPRLNDTSLTPVTWTGAHRLDWPDANLREIETGLLKQFDTVADVAHHIGCDAGTLEDTLARWNAACESGRDDDFGRPPRSMVPVKTPPFVVGDLWPIVSNTQGGPVHDEHQRVLNPFGAPVERLYAAGELGGLWGFLYLGGGNYSECVIGGRIAAKHLATLPGWDEPARR